MPMVYLLYFYQLNQQKIFTDTLSVNAMRIYDFIHWKSQILLNNLLKTNAFYLKNKSHPFQQRIILVFAFFRVSFLRLK